MEDQEIIAAPVGHPITNMLMEEGTAAPETAPIERTADPVPANVTAATECHGQVVGDDVVDLMMQIGLDFEAAQQAEQQRAAEYDARLARVDEKLDVLLAELRAQRAPA